MLEVGDLAPDFTLPRNGGGEISLSGNRPKAVVLYFYPKDDTSGCTLEAQDFTRLAADFARLDTEVIGVSKDSVEDHDAFCKKYGLGVSLVSDRDSNVCELYGVWAAKRMYGKVFLGIVRSTFLIGGDGCIQKIWPKVKADGHAEAVLQAVRDLRNAKAIA